MEVRNGERTPAYTPRTPPHYGYIGSPSEGHAPDYTPRSPPPRGPFEAMSTNGWHQGSTSTSDLNADLTRAMLLSWNMIEAQSKTIGQLYQENRGLCEVRVLRDLTYKEEKKEKKRTWEEVGEDLEVMENELRETIESLMKAKQQKREAQDKCAELKEKYARLKCAYQGVQSNCLRLEKMYEDLIGRLEEAEKETKDRDKVIVQQAKEIEHKTALVEACYLEIAGWQTSVANLEEMVEQLQDQLLLPPEEEEEVHEELQDGVVDDVVAVSDAED